MTEYRALTPNIGDKTVCFKVRIFLFGEMMVVLRLNGLDPDSPICHTLHSFVAASLRNSPSTGGLFPSHDFTNFNIRRPAIRRREST
jgi:hypothetical protein